MFSVVLKWADQDLEASLQSVVTKVNIISIGASLEVNIQNHQQGNLIFHSQFLRACLLLTKLLMLLIKMCILIYPTYSRKRSISSSSSEDSANHSKRHHHRVNKKLEEVDRLAEMERIRRQKEMEQRVVEEETQKRIELLVKKRVEEELGNFCETC